MATIKRRPAKTAPAQVNGQNGAAAHREADEQQRQQEEQELDKRIRQYINKGPEDYDPALWSSIRENLRIKLLYPGKHVVFRDRWEGQEDTLMLVEVKVLLVTDDAKEARDFATKFGATMPLQERPYLGLTYVEPPIVLTPRPRKPRKSKRVK